MAVPLCGPKARFFDSNGDPLSGGKVQTYAAGTTDPKATYTNASGNVPNTNPVILDADGEADIWLGEGSYKIVLMDSNNVIQWTVDNFAGDIALGFAGSVMAVNSNTNVIDTYNQSVITATGTINLSLLAASVAGDGFVFSVYNAGTGTVTIDPNGSETINGTATLVLTAGESVMVVCNGSNWFGLFGVAPGSITNTDLADRTIEPVKMSANMGIFLKPKAPPTISNNVTDAANDIDFESGVYFSTDAGNIILSTAFTKRLDAAWTAGTNNGGLDTGSKAANTNYSVWVIYNPTTFAFDYLFSTSATTPTLPSGFTDKRRIGWFRTDASSNILPFTQVGDNFAYTTGILSSVVVATTRTTIPLVASPVNVTTKLRISAPGTANFVFQPTTEADAAPSGTAVPLINLVSNTNGSLESDFAMGSTAQIFGRSSSSTTCYFMVLGWTDRRGRDN